MKIGLIFSLIVLLSSCGDEVTEIHRHAVSPNQATQQVGPSESENLKALEELLNQKRPNLALAQFIAKALGNDQEKVFAKAMQDMSTSEIQELVRNIQRDNLNIRKRYLYHGKNYENSGSFLTKTINSNRDLGESSLSFKTHLSVGVISYMRSKALDDIIKSHDKRAAQLSKDLTKPLAAQIASADPAAAKSIEKMLKDNVRPEKIKEKISKTLSKLELVTSTFDGADLSRSEKHIILSTGILAGGVYELIKDHKEFKRVVGQVRDLKEKIEEIKRKYKEFTVLAVSLNKHAEESLKNLSDFQEGMSRAGEGMLELYQTAFSSADGAEGVEAQRIVNFIDGKIRGKNTTDDDDGLTGQKIEQINKNLEKGIDSLGNIATGLDSIISTTTKMTDLLGIKLSGNVQKTLGTAQDIAGVVSMGSKAFKLYQTGGLSAAMSVLGGRSPLGDATSAKLGIISGKLDTVLDNQRIMIDAQLETMNMIKNLAIMIDQYHESEMGLLYDLQDRSIISLEIQKASLVNREIKSCEQLINYQLSSVWPQHDVRKSPYYNIGHFEILRSRFDKRVYGMKGIRSLVNSSGEKVFHECQSAFIKAFSGGLGLENPLMSLYESGEDNLLAFSRRVYRPSLEALKHFSYGASLSDTPLHHPMLKLKDLPLKFSLLPSEDASRPGAFPFEKGVYSLENFISVKNSERYITSLLLLHPLFEVKKADWEKSASHVIDSYLNTVDTDVAHAIKSSYYLNGALKVVQSAIAQQALISGEPIIPGLYSQFHTKLLSGSDCSDETRYQEGSLGSDFICALRSNQQLMHNYVSFALLKRGVTSPLNRDSYETAYRSGMLSELESYLGVSDGLIMKEVDGVKKPFLRLSAMRSLGQKDASYIDVRIPDIDELFEGRVQYTQSMRQLLKMQDFILYELEKVHPYERSFDPSLLMDLWTL